MLVLSRYINESIMIGNYISLMVVDVRGDKVRLGINAPPDIPVHRKEVYDAIQRENERAKETKKRTEKDKGSELENLEQNNSSRLETNVGQISDTQTSNQQTLYQQLKNYLSFKRTQKYNK